MRHPFLLLALLAGASSAPADKFEIRRKLEPDPLPPAPDHPRLGWGWTPPAPNHQGRECPTCGRILGLNVRTCANGHREVRTRRVTLDHRGRPVRRCK